MGCVHEYEEEDGDSRRCPRPAADGRNRCPFHLDDERAADVDASLQTAFCADLDSDDDRRLEYVDVTVEELDLSSLHLETDSLATIQFRDCTVERLDLSASVVSQSVILDGCEVGRLDASDATFESDVTVCDSAIAVDSTGTGLVFGRATVDGALEIAGTTVGESVEFAACTVDGWFELDDTTVAGGAHFPNATFERAQFVDTTFQGPVQFTGVWSELLTIEGVSFAQSPQFDDAKLETLRFKPTGDVESRFHGATVESGRLTQPSQGCALYDLTDATVGDVDLDCTVDTFDRYRFYRTRYDGFPFASYRTLLRENRWDLHGYAGTVETVVTIDGLERTYLEAKQGASAVGDDENAAALFVREMRYRRRRYANHARDPSRTSVHRLDATLRWTTNAFLDLTAGYGERPQRTVSTSLVVIVLSSLLYPALGGLRTVDETVTYASDGVTAFLDSLYFSVITFTTLGYGDFLAVSGLGRFVAGVEALSGAFLVALFVFSLGRQVSR